MELRRMLRALARRSGTLAASCGIASLLFATAGCTRDRPTPGPAAPGAGTEVVGTLVSVKDDRPVDGGIDLTLETAAGAREIVRVPSIFMVPPRDSVRAMHEVVDAAKPGDRLRARGTRDEDGALRAEVLQPLPR